MPRSGGMTRSEVREVEVASSSHLVTCQDEYTGVKRKPGVLVFTHLMLKSAQYINIDRVTLMSNECVPLMREDAGSYRQLEGESINCHRCGINNMFLEQISS